LHYFHSKASSIEHDKELLVVFKLGHKSKISGLV
jgi:hypothetical protein